jgi:hypothetical protein
MAMMVARAASASSTICATGSPNRTANDTMIGPSLCATHWEVRPRLCFHSARSLVGIRENTPLDLDLVHRVEHAEQTN